MGSSANIQYVKFDSFSGKEPCYATYTPRVGADSGIPDHGFRVMTDDPLFEDHDWPEQTWHENPLEQDTLPTNVDSANWIKRGLDRIQIATCTDSFPVDGTMQSLPMITTVEKRLSLDETATSLTTSAESLV